jgi:uncharacterized protein YbjT (DUF2867 family)
LVDQLLNDDRFSTIRIFVRRSIGRQHPNLQEHVISFDKPEDWRDLVTGDVLFSTLGTTLKHAGSKEAQYKVDFTYQYQFAQIAAGNGVTSYVLVSSAGANEKASFFYMRMKGELDGAVQKLPFERTRIIRPGMLIGDRQQIRMGEKIGAAALGLLNRFGILKSQRPIDAAIVAKAMISAAMDMEQGSKIYTLEEVFQLAGAS